MSKRKVGLYLLCIKGQSAKRIKMSRTKHHGDKAKQRNLADYWNWMATPAWWIRLKMTRPQRRKASTWQKEAEKTDIVDLKELDKPLSKRKPHHYFW